MSFILLNKQLLQAGRILKQGVLNESRRGDTFQFILQKCYSQQGQKRLATRYTYERMVQIRWQTDLNLSQIADYLERTQKELKVIGELEKGKKVECESVGAEGKIMLSTTDEQVAMKHKFLRGVWDVVETVSSVGKVLYEDWSWEPTAKQIYDTQKQEWVEYDLFNDPGEIEGGVLDLDNIADEEEEEQQKQSHQ